MKTYRITVESTEQLYIDVQADNEAEAQDVANDADGSEFLTVNASGTWEQIEIAEVSNE